MSDQCNTVVALKEHFERILDEREKALVLAAKPVETRLELLCQHVHRLEATVERMRGAVMALTATAGTFGTIAGIVVGHYWK